RHSSPAHARRSLPDGVTSLFLQRDLLHLRARPHCLLWHQVGSGRLVHLAVRGGQFPRAALPRPAVRYGRTPRHDRHHLRAFTAYLFAAGMLTATKQTIAWTVIFFFASAAASSAYLTVSETFPLEVRALAIAFFYAVGTGVGGVAAPWLFGVFIDTGSRLSLS